MGIWIGSGGVGLGDQVWNSMVVAGENESVRMIFGLQQLNGAL